ncbi:MAG: TonB-dependent receptor [Dehalococcoidia bacterium]
MSRVLVSCTLTLVLVLGVGGTPGAATAQEGTISGVVSQTGSLRPLTGVQVSIPGTGIGRVTDAQGRFQLTGVPIGEHDVEARMIGYRIVTETVVVSAGESVSVNFSLAQAALSLDEVVVTGTAGGARQREVGSSISTINAEQLQSSPVADLQGALQGRAAGLSLQQNSGQPGAGGTIRLRGNNSVSQGNEPLIYIDGVRIYSGYGPTTGGSMQAYAPQNDINPADIERIEVVRGPAATTLYGTEASGGVIQIFTKSGSEGAAVWNAQVSMGVNNLGHFGPKGDPTGLTFVQCTGPNLVDGLGNTFTDVTCPSSGSWLRNGLVQRYSVGVQGGVSAFSYSLSGNYRSEEGVLPTGWAKEGGFRANFLFTPHPSLQVRFNQSFAAGTTRWVPEGNRSYSFILNVARGPYNQFKIGGDVANDLILAQESYDRKKHFISGMTIDHSIGARFNHRFALGYDFNDVQATHNAPLGFSRFPNGQLQYQEWEHGMLSLDYVASFRSSFGERVTGSTSWGGQVFQDVDRRTGIIIDDYAAPGVIPTLTLGSRRDIQSDNRLRVVNAGLFLQHMVGFEDRLFVTGGVRVDGNSAFGSNFGLQPYPKVSLSYILSDHDFLPYWAEEVKLRGAVGDAGKAPGAFDAVQSWQPVSVDGGSPGFTPHQVGNPDLGPERTREYEFGVDFSGFDSRIGVEMTGFLQRTTDALIPVFPIASLGFSQPQLENLGVLENRGYEIMLNGTAVRRPGLELDLGLQYSKVSSRAIDLGGEDILISDVGRTWVREGYPVPSYFGDVITNPSDGSDPVVESDAFIGSVYPTGTLGISSQLRIRDNLTLDALGEYQGGGHNLNATGWLNARRNIWQPCYDVQDRLRRAEGGEAGALAGVTALERGKCAINVADEVEDAWIQPTDFFRLRHVTATYNLPENLIPGAAATTLSLSGRNLWTLTDYDGLDPEMSDSGFEFWRREYYNMPSYRTFLASVRVRF